MLEGHRQWVREFRCSLIIAQGKAKRRVMVDPGEVSATHSPHRVIGEATMDNTLMVLWLPSCVYVSLSPADLPGGVRACARPLRPHQHGGVPPVRQEVGSGNCTVCTGLWIWRMGCWLATYARVAFLLKGWGMVYR